MDELLAERLSQAPDAACESPARRQYFHSLYQEQDPYGSKSRWYERRKRSIVLSALPRQRFRTAFEPACGTGELTIDLSARCGHVLASDFCEQALVQARDGPGRLDNVTLEMHALPAGWPTGERRFDLIVIGEVCSFLHADEVAEVAQSCARSLDHDGVLVVCDWRWPFDARLSEAAGAHDVFDAAGLHRLVRHEEADFLLGVWSVAPLSVAEREGIV
jgi:SAM-dependent methyltransferase